MRKNHLYSAANTWWHQIHHMCSSGRCKIHRIWRSSSAWSKGNRRNCNCHTLRFSQKIPGLSNWILSSRQAREFQSSHTERTRIKSFQVSLVPIFHPVIVERPASYETWTLWSGVLHLPSANKNSIPNMIKTRFRIVGASNTPASLLAWKTQL